MQVIGFFLLLPSTTPIIFSQKNPQARTANALLIRTHLAHKVKILSIFVDIIYLIGEMTC